MLIDVGNFYIILLAKELPVNNFILTLFIMFHYYVSKYCLGGVPVCLLLKQAQCQPSK
jgi:hypothetical protein